MDMALNHNTFPFEMILASKWDTRAIMRSCVLGMGALEH